MKRCKYDIRTTKGFEDLDLYNGSLTSIVKHLESKNYIKIDGLVSILSFEVNKKGLKPIKVYADPHEKILLIQYLEEETSMDKALVEREN